jgi:CubicO group peptidase (beta-lactamase class C family)
LAVLLLLAASSCGLFEPEPPELVGCLPSYAAVEQVTAAQLADSGVLNAALLVRVDGQTVCRLFFGHYGPTTEVATASAAKWLSAGAILAVVDRGGLQLDTRAVDLFPSAPPLTADITLSQLLSHTSGLLWFSRCMGRPGFTLQECAETILEGDVHFAPGTGFYYAGPPFTVAGAMAERASGQSWAELFRTRIAQPLGMSHTSYGDSPNPALSEGEVVSTVDDYGRFAQMILDNGVVTRRRVLSEQAIRDMRRNWSTGVPIVYSPRGEVPYGLGVWLDAVDATGLGTVISSPGIGGFVPLVDFNRRMVFVFETEEEVGRIWPVVTAILAAVRAAVDQQGLTRSPDMPPEASGSYRAPLR